METLYKFLLQQTKNKKIERKCIVGFVLLNLYSRFLETLLVSKIIKKNIGYSLFKIVRSHYQD
jgi:hypothetical protein